MNRYTTFLKKAARFFRVSYRQELFRLRGAMQDTVTMQTKQGRLTMFTRDDGIGKYLYGNGQFEYDLSLRAVGFLKEAGFIPSAKVCMFDVGANIGVISIGLLLAKRVDLALAIEPEPRNFTLLRKNVKQNKLSDRLLCLPVAVGVEASTLDMELSPNNLGDHRIRAVAARDASESMRESARQTIRVRSLPLVQVLKLPEVQSAGLASPSFMWVDVQGYEGYVFKGAKGLLEGGLPTVSEIWPYGILRSGMSLEDFADTVGSIWSHYWIDRRNRLVRYPITVFNHYLDELGTDGHFENVIFTKNAI